MNLFDVFENGDIYALYDSDAIAFAYAALYVDEHGDIKVYAVKSDGNTLEHVGDLVDYSPRELMTLTGAQSCELLRLQSIDSFE